MSRRAWAVGFLAAVLVFGGLALVGLGDSQSQLLIGPPATVAIVVLIAIVDGPGASRLATDAAALPRVRLRALGMAIGLLVAGLLIAAVLNNTVGAVMASAALLWIVVLAYGGWIARSRDSTPG